MKNNISEISAFGERSVLIKFAGKIDQEMLFQILRTKKSIEDYYIKVKVYITHSYNSLLVTYTHVIEDIYGVISQLKGILKEGNSTWKPRPKKHRIPVCYHEKFGLDLKEISSQKNLSIEEIIYLHTSASYRLFFLGFLPGFLYLEGLNDKLHVPRKGTPRDKIQVGAVGIGGSQTGIYPQESPGGWQIIGNSPLVLFDPSKDPPSPFEPGDEISFYSISLEEHQRWTRKKWAQTSRDES